MPLKTVTFKIQEKQASNFAKKCKNEGKSMYSILKWLVDKYIKSEITSNSTLAEIEDLKPQIEIKEPFPKS